VGGPVRAQILRVRPGRGCHDAIEAIYNVCAGPMAKRTWALDADLAAAFDRIDHSHLLEQLGSFPARDLIRDWLKAGVFEAGKGFAPTEEGTPQGGVISPCLLNVALHGLEEAAGVRYVTSGNHAGETIAGSPVAIRYADDMTVLCHSPEWYVWATHKDGKVTLLSADGSRNPSFVRRSRASIPEVVMRPNTAREVNATMLLQRFWGEYEAAQAYDRALVASAQRRWAHQLRRWVYSGSRSGAKIGFILGTFSPVHNGHLALVDQAVRDLSLDHVYVITWPFVRIKGFHPSGMRRWVRDQQHIGWLDRVALLQVALADRPVTVLSDARAWYMESRGIYSRDDSLSVYWTGMWYVARKLQWFLDQSTGRAVKYTQICGSDQFNYHVVRLLAPDMVQPWNDYSITRALATHHMYVIPRNEKQAPVERFSPPHSCPQTITFGASTPFRDLAAAAIRFSLLNEDQKLEDVLPEPVARLVRAQGWWGY
jgi:nicotinic acid mononucleotide adenylyltransferase